MSNYRHVKNWLLADFPQHRANIERRLLDMGKMLEHYCVKQQGDLVKKAPACTKEDLRLLIDDIFSHATSAKDYQDAALLSLMWYAFGRASDLSFVRKCNLSVAADNIFFLQFVRTKTYEEQGIILFLDQRQLRDVSVEDGVHRILRVALRLVLALVGRGARAPFLAALYHSRNTTLGYIGLLGLRSHRGHHHHRSHGLYAVSAVATFITLSGLLGRRSIGESNILDILSKLYIEGTLPPGLSANPTPSPALALRQWLGLPRR
jgi:hypothetical protein